MASTSNFPSCKKCTEFLQYDINNIDDTAPGNFYNDDRNILLRQHAVSVIAKVTKEGQVVITDAQGTTIPDTFVPYLAMNYFDRFLSHCDMTHVEGQADIEKVRLIAISCYTFSARLRSQSFMVNRFLSDLDMDLNWITEGMVRTMWHYLEEKPVTVTAFCFLDHFNAHFEPPGLKRRILNEIIVQAQGVHTFVDFMPADIAFSACVAAATIARPFEKLPEDINNIINSNMPCFNKVNQCVGKMITFSYIMNILIEKAAEDIEEPQPQPQPQMEPPMNYMNFELKWPTDVPPLEEEKDATAKPKLLRVPVTAVDSAKSLPTAISLRIPGTAKNINIGCCTCNIS
ncbi:hypothetical protein P8452_14645 [Trifolium repens]|nr:hypothetical protein P8452_14645 [Trifolium repens]